MSTKSAAATLESEVSGRTLYLFEEPTGPLDVTDQVFDAEFPGFGTESLAEAADADKPGFWRRQFGKTVTKKQRVFDWLFGVVMPVICFGFDPIVFKTSSFGRPMLEGYTLFGYGLSFLAIMTTMAWLIWGDRLKGLTPLASGIMAGGAIASLVIAVILSPFSFIGLAFFFVGALGFTPFLTAIIWARNAVRSFRSAKEHFAGPLLAHIVGLTAVASIAIPLVANSVFGRRVLVELARLIR